MICRKGLMRAGVFYEEDTGFHCIPLIPQHLEIPEEKLIFLNFSQHDVVTGFIEVD